MDRQEYMVQYVAQENIHQALVQYGNTVVHSKLSQFSVQVPSRSISIKTALNGTEEYRVNGNSYTLTESEFLLVRTGDIVECNIDSPQPVEGMCYYLDDRILGDICHCYKQEEAELLNCPFDWECDTFDLMANAYRLDDSGLSNYLRQSSQSLRPGISISNEWFYGLAVHLMQHQGAVRNEIRRLPASKRSTREELYKRLLTGRAYIEAHLQDSVSMDEVAREACLSTYHFIRRFSQAFGISPYQYLMKIRLEKAASLLVKTELPMRHIASHIGMGDIHLFSRQFKRHFGINPSRYRTNCLID